MTPTESRTGEGSAGRGERKTPDAGLPRNAVALSTPERKQCIRPKCGTAVLWRVTYGQLYDHQGRPYWRQVWDKLV